MAAATCVVTGTDTGVGKTRVSCALLAAAAACGLRAVGFKPVASGAEPDARGRLRNDDALALARHANVEVPYDWVNPYVFAPAIAPHLAAAQAGTAIDPAVLDQAHQRLCARADIVVLEGAGGWRVPLGADREFAQWVSAHAWPVVLVVGIRLGCLNHALLSAEAIGRDTHLLGWIANVPPPAPAEEGALVDDLRARLATPLLARSAADAPPADLAAALRPWLQQRFAPTPAAAGTRDPRSA